MESFSVTTNHRNQFIDITNDVKKAVNKLNISSGVITVFCPHTTAAITINENADPDVTSDMMQKLNSLVPPHEGYAHAEGNSDSHIKSSLVGNSCQIIVEDDRLQLGTWQGIYFCEFDGPRTRKVWVQ
ncbi:MAG: secondary thiamine-phosphate synthase enzyme YjbQ [Fidelibacterota bacterium]